MDNTNIFSKDTAQRRAQIELQAKNEEIRQMRVKARKHGLDTEIGKAYFTVAELLEQAR